MLQKWKLIINNWINCYFDEQDVRHVNTDSLLTIISHLRENLNKYESKSSVLEALTVEEFILKKYPGFKFKNGTVNADNEDDIYLVASLLLFFVCVNSKDMDLKSAMCSKLSADDQEIIMKFSKSLMECSLIGCEDVQTAIIEACGTDIANIDTGHRRVAVAETPPALRSLHGEVRRLQAALDAERFDRNFLQEELSRTNLRLEKLTKDKEQYKLDIRDLKAKISLCSRGDYDAMQMENSEKQSIKLERQLEDMEERLIKTQEQLEEAVYEKDSLMMKLEGLKQDRDKWFTLSQQESARAVQLSEELETERRQVQSLKELVNELRQHNRLNRLDSSLLECDDPDASIQSLGHNLSVCSEACVNVIEVQLSEERAKVEALKQQIQTLQKENEQLQFAIEEDNSNHEIMLKEKDCIIDTLEQQLKTQNTLLESLQKDHEDVTLSWEKHKLKTREIIEVKDERIQKLNEHLGSLKQEFSDLENVNQELTVKIEIMLKETAHSEKMYNDKILEENLAKELLLKDKERLLSENNSLKQDVLDQKAVQEVLLNDKQLLILEKQGLIDALDVKKSEHDEIEKRLQIKFEDIRELYKQITVTLNVGFDKLIQDLIKDNFTKKILQNLFNYDSDQISSIDKCDLLINIANTLHTTVVAKIKALNHINTSMKSLREVIKQRERQISELQTGNKHMQETVRKTKNELSKQNETNASILHSKLEEIQSLQQENQNLTNELNTVKIQMELKVHSLKEKLVDCENETDELKKDYECQVENLNVIINKVTEHLKEKTNEIQLAAEEKEKMQQEVEKYKNEIKCLEEELKSNIQNLERVSNEFESEKLVLKNMVTVTESVMEDQKVSLNNAITELMNENKLLQEEKSAIKQQIENVTAEFEAIMREKETALELITKEHAELTLIKESLEEEKDTARKAIMTLECEIEKKENEIVKLKEEHDAILSILDAEIISLKSDAREKDEQLEKTKLENSALETVILNYEDNVLKSLEKENAELKIKVDSLETEHLNKVDTLIESLQKEVENKKYLQIELNQKSETTLNMESKLKCIEEELNTIKLEKSELAKEKTISLTKINDLELNQLKNAEAIKTLNEYSMKLKDECAKLKESKSDLELYIAKVNKYNSEFQQDIAQTIATLNEEIAELQQNIEVLKKTNSELQENNVKLNKNITKSEKDLHNLNKVNMELTGELTKIKAEHEDTTNNFLKEKTAHEKQNEQISTILSAGLTKLIQDLKEEAITNETIQHLINIENNDTSTVEKCDMLINIANMVTAETIMRKNLEKALEHENAVLAELKKMLQQKEMHILELESEIKRLQQIVNENKIELSKQNEMHSRALDNKIREMQILQQDNASLTNDLNDVKVQLEVKVHSLKEKLIDNENLTDKLKKTYECQIDNLNIMITKLTNYLKDKSVELEIARKEKDRLQQVIEDNNQAIKSLEEEVKTEKLSQEKLMNDFESERQVIKNMVAVTESVMADQKATFNNTISEKEKAIEILQEENRIISEERNELEVELRNKETALEHMQTELVDLKQVKECLEKEITSLKETLDNEISALKTEIHKKENEIRALKEENSQLEIINKNYKDSAVSLANQNSELKIKKDAIEVEFRDKVEKLTESLQEQIDNKKELNIELNEKTNSIHELENKLKDLQNKLIVFEQEKKHVTIEKDEYLSKVNEIQAGIENHKLKASEEMNKLNKDRAELLEENETLKQKIIELEEGSNKSMKLITELKEQIAKLQNKLSEEMNTMTKDKTELFEEKESLKKKNTELEEQTDKSVKLIMELKEQMAKLEKESTEEISRFTKEKTELFEEKERLVKKNTELEEGTDKSTTLITELKEQIAKLQKDSNFLTEEINKLRSENLILVAEVTKLTNINVEMNDDIEKKKAEITHLEENIKGEQDKRIKLQDDLNNEKVTLVNKCDILENYHTKAETELEERQKDIVSLQKQVQNLQAKVEMCVTESAAKDGLISKMSKEKDVQIYDINKELQEEKVLRTKYQNDLEEKIAIISVLKKNLDELNSEREALKILKRENEELIKAVGHRETFAVRSHENASTRKYSGQLAEKELRDLHIQVDNTSDITHSSIESLKTITDLEKIIHDKNRTITTLQSDITYLKTLMGESENKLLDVNKELELSKENCYQLSSQLKKIVHQKNEDIAELKKQISKMTVAENRATQIIKVSAKYQAIILKRIAEIKSNTILKELTNFGNTNTTCDSEVRRSLTAGSITMEDLENFLETTERHLKKCSEKQLALQKEKDRLTEVSRINESENINMKKFLTELSVRFQTFSSVKDLYAQKLSRVISVQRTVRREILSLEGHVTDKCMLKLERGYAAVMQDLAECTMNLERWVERSIGRTVSSEKIKQAVLKEEERSSLAPSTIQNTGLEVQLDELLNSFQKLLEEVSRAPKGEDAKDAQAVTLMEVRAEYEDKLNRMKSKMKQLYTEQIAVFKEKQKKEIAMLERELARARDTLSQSSRAYEDHIRGLTTELWSVGEKFLIQKDEAKYLRRKQQSGSLMSLQHVHSSGLVPTQEEAGRSSDTQSLRSLPVVNNGGTKREGRGLHMSDEEGEVFDNRYLQELATPRRVREPREGRDTGPPERLSELRWRNSLCPPHLKSSYPAETQFANAIDEDEIKAMGGGPAAVAGRQQRKEVGIIAYKKPGPPTPSKQAGRLSATDSELRESLRVEADPQPTRKTTTPSRIRNLFRSSKTDHSTDGTPRSRRLSNIFRKK